MTKSERDINPKDKDILPTRYNQLMQLVTAQHVVTDCLVDLDNIDINRLTGSIGEAIERQMQEIEPNDAKRASFIRKVEKSFKGLPLVSVQYEMTKDTIQNLVALDPQLNDTDILHLTDAIQRRADDARYYEQQTAQRRLKRRGNWIRSGILATNLILGGALLGAAGGLGAQLINDSSNPPAYVTNEDRSIIVGELQDAVDNLHYKPAEQTTVTDYQGVSSVVFQPARLPRPDVAWHDLSDIEEKLTGVDPSIIQPLKQMENELANPQFQGTSFDSLFTKQRDEITREEQVLPQQLAETPAALNYDKQLAFDNTAAEVAGNSLLTLGLALGPNIVFRKRRARWKEEQKSKID